MTSLTKFARPSRVLPVAMLLVAFALLTACGGGDGSASAPPPPPPGGEAPPPSPPAAIEGVAMPASVAVVTATNTQ